MKNYQQTPRQRKAQLAKAKTIRANQRNQPFQPLDAYASKRKVSSGYLDVLNIKQVNAGHMGATHEQELHYWNPWAIAPRWARR